MEDKIYNMINAKVEADRATFTRMQILNAALKEQNTLIHYLQAKELAGMNTDDISKNRLQAEVEMAEEMGREYDNCTERLFANKLFNVTINELLTAIGRKLDSEYGYNRKYKRDLYLNFEKYEREEDCDDEAENYAYTMYSQTVEAGFETKSPDRKWILPTIAFDEREYLMSKNYMLQEETVNLIDQQLIGADSGEFARTKWQDLFWAVYRSHLRNLVREARYSGTAEEYESLISELRDNGMEK